MALPVTHTDLGSAVLAELRSLIISGDFAVGERLVETELAERFDVSRGPIRDALLQLERGGLVELRPRKGSFVRSMSANDVEEIYSLRIALESLAVRIAVGIDAPTTEMKTHLAGLEAAHRSGDRRAIGEADMALHRSFIVASGHQRLLDAWETLADQTLFMMAKLPTVDRDIQGPMGAHSAIVDAVADSNADAAAGALTQHLEEARIAMLPHFGQQ